MANDVLYVPFGEWDEADKKTGALVPEGEYTLKVSSVETTKIKSGANEGTPGLIVWFKVVGGEYDGADIVDRFYIMKSTLWRFAGFLRAAGLKVTQNDMSLPYNQLINKRVTAQLVDGDEFKGARKSEVTSYAPAVKTAPMQGSGLTEDVVFTEDIPTQSISPERADAITKGSYEAEDPWALDGDTTL